MKMVKIKVDVPSIKQKALKNYNKGFNGLNEPKNKGIIIPKVICLSSFRPLYKQNQITFEKLKKIVHNYLYYKNSKIILIYIL